MSLCVLFDSAKWITNHCIGKKENQSLISLSDFKSQLGRYSAQYSSIMAGCIYSAVLQGSKTPFLKILLASFPCSLRCHSSRLRSALKNLSLRKTVTPPCLVCKLRKLAKLHQTKLTYALRLLEMWHSKFGNPREGRLFAWGTAQSCNYWFFFCKEAEALTLPWQGSSGSACFLCLLKSKVIKRCKTLPSVYCEFPNPFPNSPHSYQFWSYITLESRGCSVLAQRWLRLSGTPLIPYCTLELVASWFKMSFICSRNGSTNDLGSAEVLWMPPSRCFLNTEGDTVPSKDKRWAESMSKKNDLGAERHVSW